MSSLLTPRPGLYLCSRSSSFSSSASPCEDAFRARIAETDWRCVSDPALLPGGKREWFASGTNHRVVDGRIGRDLGEEEVWAVEIEDVLAFVAQHGPCILQVTLDGFWSIEIYDDYRE